MTRRVGNKIRSRWQFLSPRPVSPLILWFWPFTFIWVVYSRQTANLWGQRHLSIPRSLFLTKMKSYVFIFLWCFINPEMCGISAFAEQVSHLHVHYHISNSWSQRMGSQGVPPPTRAPLLWSALFLRFHLVWGKKIASCMGKC